MQHKRLGKTGLKVSQLCLGTMNFGWSADEAESHRIMDAAFGAGINFLDTADIYSRWIEGNPGGVSEEIIGRWLKTKDRRDIIIATKVRGRMWDGPNGEGLSRHHILTAVDDSLRRLDTDYIDLYQTHWPDADTPLEETLYALDHLVQSGKVRYIGASNHPAWLLTKTLWVSDKANISRYESLQPHYSMFHRSEYERELRDLCADQHIGVIPYSPLAAGFLTGKYTREQQRPDSTRTSGSLIQRLLADDHAFTVMDTIREMANGYGVPPAQIALAWMFADETITSPIIGARTVEQLEQVIGAADVTLTTEEVQTLNDLTVGY